MKISAWKENDGYWESEVRFNTELPPFAILRVVKDSRGFWQPIIRECQTETKTMIASAPLQTTAMMAAMRCNQLLRDMLEDFHFQPLTNVTE